jgi:hypothetical protein
MARAATRAARREQERKERRQNPRALPTAQQTVVHNGHGYLSPAPANPTACAIHEAGHCVVAHALGMHVIYATIKPETVLPGGVCRKGHPGEHLNTTDAPFRSDGFNAAEPLLAAEVEEQVTAGLPLTAEHQLWLAQSAVSSAAGPLAELSADLGDGGARSDLQQVSLYVAILVNSQQPQSEIPDRTKVDESTYAALNAARIILNESRPQVVAFANRLLADLELDAQACQAALDGLPCGNYAWMLKDLLAYEAAENEAGA